MTEETKLREIALNVAVLYDRDRKLSAAELMKSAGMFYDFLVQDVKNKED